MEPEEVLCIFCTKKISIEADGKAGGFGDMMIYYNAEDFTKSLKAKGWERPQFLLYIRTAICPECFPQFNMIKDLEKNNICALPVWTLEEFICFFTEQNKTEFISFIKIGLSAVYWECKVRIKNKTYKGQDRKLEIAIKEIILKIVKENWWNK